MFPIRSKFGRRSSDAGSFLQTKMEGIKHLTDSFAE